MWKKIALGLVLAAAGLSYAQTDQPTKNAPADALTWRNGMPMADINIIGHIDRGLSQEDKYMVWTAIVRNREASRDMYKGEPLTNDKVLANVRVRMSTEESSRWTTTWSHLNSWQRQAIIHVLRDDLARPH